MTDEKLRCLVVEDRENTISSLIFGLEDNMEVRRAPTLAEAEEWLTSERYDLVLADLKVPRAGAVSGTGVELLIALKSGEFGDLNQEVRFAILTAYPHDVDAVAVRKLHGCQGVFYKADNLVAELALVLHSVWPALALDPAYDVPAYVVTDLVHIAPDPVDITKVIVEAEAVELSAPLSLGAKDLPAEVRQELEFGYGPITAWAQINVLASDPADLCPHNYELVLPDADYLDEFDAGRVARQMRREET